MLVASAPNAALETARTVLGGVLALPSQDWDLLLSTFNARLEADGSARAASAVLFCHPNTVRYRLAPHRDPNRQLTEQSCEQACRCSPELVTAARAWSLLPYVVPS